jgi:hypothetical protein
VARNKLRCGARSKPDLTLSLLMIFSRQQSASHAVLAQPAKTESLQARPLALVDTGQRLLSGNPVDLCGVAPIVEGK